MKRQTIVQVQFFAVRSFQIRRDFGIAKRIASDFGRPQCSNNMDQLPRVGWDQGFCCRGLRGNGSAGQGDACGLNVTALFRADVL